VASREVLVAAVAREARRFGIPYEGPGSTEPDQISTEVPRPPNWGGYRLWIDAVELWVEGEYRIHDRARWTRTLVQATGTTGTAGTGSPGDVWTATRLQP
jgi:pyridoxamine 5'-phosphate oxidase